MTDGTIVTAIVRKDKVIARIYWEKVDYADNWWQFVAFELLTDEPHLVKIAEKEKRTLVNRYCWKAYYRRTYKSDGSYYI